MAHEFIVHRRQDPLAKGSRVSAEDGLEAVSTLYPEQDFEVLDVEGDKTFVIDIHADQMHIAVRQN